MILVILLGCGLGLSILSAVVLFAKNIKYSYELSSMKDYDEIRDENRTLLSNNEIIVTKFQMQNENIQKYEEKIYELEKKNLALTSELRDYFSKCNEFRVVNEEVMKNYNNILGEREKMEAVFSAKAKESIEEVTKSLIVQTKNENTETREKFKEEVTQMQEQFGRIGKNFGAFASRIEKNDKDMEILRNSFLSPNRTGLHCETILENNLHRFGFEIERDYFKQKTIRTKNGSDIRPDFIIRLPNDMIYCLICT